MPHSFDLLFTLFLHNIQIALLYQTAWFVFAILKKDNSIVDIGWGLGFIVLAIVTYFQRDLTPLNTYLMLGMTLFWGLRLSVYIIIRNWAKSEDFRYKKWREDWGKNWIAQSYLKVFMLQGLIMSIVALPIVHTIESALPQTTISVYAQAGIFIWFVGFLIESIADTQLYLFKRNKENKGKIMQSGIWRYSRHPNYFGEILIWWGFFLVSLSVDHGWITIISPLCITFFLVKVSGVPMLEKKYAHHSEYQEYRKKTNELIPWLRRKD